MELTNQVIKLTTFEQSDFELFCQMRMCPEMMEHIYTPFTLEETKVRFDASLLPWDESSSDWLSFSITLIESSEKVGNIAIKITDHAAKIAEVGFMIAQSAQGQGVGSQALSLIKGFAFNDLKLNKLEATCAVANTASYKLLEKHGFIREEELKNNSEINGKWVDDYRYGLMQKN